MICNEANEKLMLPILLDGAFIMNKNVRAINSKKKNVEPLYTEEDVYLLMNKCETYSMNEIHQLDDIVSFQLVNAGHILGSSQLVLYVKTPNVQKKKLHFTSDLGSEYNKQPFVPSKDIVTSSNFSLFEATYNDLNRGFKSKKECDKEREEFKKFIMRGNVLDHEPHLALFVPDDDALKFYEAIAQIAARTLSSQGFGIVEINEALGAETEQVFIKAGFAKTAVLKDLSDRNRFVFFSH